MAARNFPMAMVPSMRSLRRSVPPKRYESVGFRMSVEKDVVTFDTAPPKTKPMASPITPRSRMNSMNPVTVPLSCSRTMQILYRLIDRFVHESVCLLVLFAPDVDEFRIREVRNQEIMHLHVLWPERFFLYLIFIGELSLNKFGIHPYFNFSPCKSTLLRFRKCEYPRLVLCPIIRPLADVLLELKELFLSIKRDNTRSCGPWIIPGTSVCIDNDRHYETTATTPACFSRIRYACTIASIDTGMLTRSPTKSASAPRMLRPISASERRKSCHRCPLVMRALSFIASMGQSLRSTMRYGVKINASAAMMPGTMSKMNPTATTMPTAILPPMNFQ